MRAFTGIGKGFCFMFYIVCNLASGEVGWVFRAVPQSAADFVLSYFEFVQFYLLQFFCFFCYTVFWYLKTARLICDSPA